MSEPLDQDTVAAESAEDAEVVDALPVPEPEDVVAARAPVTAEREPARGARGLVIGTPVAVQAAAVGVTAFAAGAATVAVVRHRRARKSGRRALGRRKGGAEVLASRSFLVDVHLLNRD